MHEVFTVTRGFTTKTYSLLVEPLSRGPITIDGTLSGYECMFTAPVRHELVDFVFDNADGFEHPVYITVKRVFEDQSELEIYYGEILKMRTTGGVVELTAASHVRLEGWQAPRGAFTTRDWIGYAREVVLEHSADVIIDNILAEDVIVVQQVNAGVKFAWSRVKLGGFSCRGITTPIINMAQSGGDYTLTLADFRPDLSRGINAVVVSGYDGTVLQATQTGRLLKFSGFPYISGGA